VLDVRSAMRRSAGFHHARIAVIAGDQRLTYGEAWSRGLRLANALLGLGLRAGDRVAVLEENSVEAVDFLCATAAANLVRVPLYRRNSPAAHLGMIRGTGCRAVVVAAEFTHEIASVRGQLGDTRIIVRDGHYESWLAAHPDTDPDPVIGPDDLVVIRHSAGTTGQAKGIAYSHRSWMATERDWFYLIPPISAGERCLHVGPISHGSGYVFLPCWLAGGTNVLESGYDGARVLDLLANNGIGYLFAVPTMLADLVAQAGGRRGNWPELKALVISGAPISAATALAGREVFGDTLFQMYGQTEAVPVAFMGPREWFTRVEGPDPLRAAGRVMPFAELEIRDGHNRPVPTGSPGQIAIRCDGQMTGIWNDPELTATHLIDGWVLTGDVGRLDRNGYLYVLDRASDMIVSGGFDIWPAELENVISELPGVREVAVFGIPDRRWGETPAAVVVLAEGSVTSAADVVEACRQRLGSYKRPTEVTLRGEPLPRNPVGKILRKTLREPYWQGHERRVSGS
jgi:acyl-CoA synthetase (AMP-forming)/AMP-acid ligase II